MTVRDAAFRTMFMLLKEIDVGIYLLINSGVTKKKKHNRYKYVNKYLFLDIKKIQKRRRDKFYLINNVSFLCIIALKISLILIRWKLTCVNKRQHFNVKNKKYEVRASFYSTVQE